MISIMSSVPNFGIYADGTMIYSCFSSKFDKPDKVNAAVAIEKDLNQWLTGVRYGM